MTWIKHKSRKRLVPPSTNAMRPPAAVLTEQSSFRFYFVLVVVTVLAPAVWSNDLGGQTAQALWFRSFAILTLPPYAYLLLRHPSLRPVLTFPLSGAVLSFLFISLLATLLGVNPARSFWGTYLRQTGTYHLIHLTLLYFYVLLIARVSQVLLMKLLLILPFVGVLASLYAGLAAAGIHRWIAEAFLIRQLRSSAIYENPDFFGAILVLTLTLTLYFCCHASRKAHRILYIIAIVVQLIGLFLSATRGPVLAIGASALLAAVLLGYKAQTRAYRYTAIALLVTLGAGALFFASGDARSSQSFFINRLAHLDDMGGYFRLTYWRIGIAGFFDHPILGVGPENYEVVYQKHFDTHLLTLDSATYPFTAMVDKPHNAELEILITTGLFGATAYIAVVMLIMYAFVSAQRKGLISWAEMVVLLCGGVAYQIQAASLFDTPASSVAFYLYAGFAAGLWMQSGPLPPDQALGPQPFGWFSRAFVLALTGISCCAAYITGGQTAITIRNIFEGAALISLDPHAAIDCLDRADHSYFIYDRTFLAEWYKALAIFMVSHSEFDRQLVYSVLDSATAAARRAVKSASDDEAVWLDLMHLYLLRARYDHVPLNKSMEVSIRKAIDLAPNRIEPLEYLALYDLDRDDVTGAMRIVERMLKVAPRRERPHWIQALVFEREGKEELAVTAAGAAMELGYRPETAEDIEWLIQHYSRLHNYSALVSLYNLCLNIDSCDSRSNAGLASSYAAVADTVDAEDAWVKWKGCEYWNSHSYRALARFYERVLPLSPSKSQLYVRLARVYRELGENEKAKVAAERAAELNPDIDYQMMVFAKMLQ